MTRGPSKYSSRGHQQQLFCRSPIFKNAPPIKEAFIGTFIEQLWPFTEVDGKVIDQWCQGEVAEVMKNNKVLIEWSNDCLREGDPKVTKEKLLVSLWNKHKEGAWRLDIDKS